ncbi:MAG: hypothetical protein Q4E64_04820 [Phascolarctobacterium sp.]|nr:hypothetical protein [Phascolarctobacterium sp.]
MRQQAAHIKIFIMKGLGVNATETNFSESDYFGLAAGDAVQRMGSGSFE